MFGYGSPQDFLLTVIAILICIVLHEVAHAFVALRCGDSTARDAGRLTLNPIAHFDLIGFLMLVFARIGYARPVPVNPNNFRHRKRGMVAVALSGIIVNLLLAFLFTPLMLLSLRITNSTAGYYLFKFLLIFIILNVNIALFNVLPVYPLDGFEVVDTLAAPTSKYVKFMRNYGNYVLMVFVGISVIVSSTGMPFYLDPLGTYLGYVGGWIRQGFTAFWQLIVR